MSKHVVPYVHIAANYTPSAMSSNPESYSAVVVGLIGSDGDRVTSADKPYSKPLFHIRVSWGLTQTSWPVIYRDIYTDGVHCYINPTDTLLYRNTLLIDDPQYDLIIKTITKFADGDNIEDNNNG